MVITKTPYRISLFGGGSDYPNWYLKHGGGVITTSIDKFCYMSCRELPPFFEHNYRVVYSKIEACNLINEIEHPAVRGVLNSVDNLPTMGLEIHYDGDLPAKSGMGSSSAFTVGLLLALNGLNGRMLTKRQLAEEAIYIEQKVLNETVGSQDQIQAAYGGFNHIEFNRNGEFFVEPIMLPQHTINELDNHLMLFYTGIERIAATVASTFVPNIDQKRESVRIIQHLADEALTCLAKDDILEIGILLDEYWKLKRNLSSKVTNTKINNIYERAKTAGALGGKLNGAGAGGTLLLFAPPDNQEDIKKELSDLTHIPFTFHSRGSEVVYYSRAQ